MHAILLSYYSVLFSRTFLKKLKAFLSRNSFLTTTAECSFKRFDTQCPHALFKLVTEALRLYTKEQLLKRF